MYNQIKISGSLNTRIPAEMLVVILSFSTKNELLNFRVICKFWNHIIETSNFLNKKIFKFTPQTFLLGNNKVSTDFYYKPTVCSVMQIHEGEYKGNILTCANDGVIKIWDAKNWSCKKTIVTNQKIKDAVLLPTKNYSKECIAIAGRKSVEISFLGENKCIKEFKNEDRIQHLLYLKHGEYAGHLAVVSDKFVKIFDLEKIQHVKKISFNGPLQDDSKVLELQAGEYKGCLVVPADTHKFEIKKLGKEGEKTVATILPHISKNHGLHSNPLLHIPCGNFKEHLLIGQFGRLIIHNINKNKCECVLTDGLPPYSNPSNNGALVLDKDHLFTWGHGGYIWNINNGQFLQRVHGNLKTANNEAYNPTVRFFKLQNENLLSIEEGICTQSHNENSPKGNIIVWERLDLKKAIKQRENKHEVEKNNNCTIL